MFFIVKRDENGQPIGLTEIDGSRVEITQTDDGETAYLIDLEDDSPSD